MRALTLTLIFLLQYQYLSGQASNWKNACPNWLQYNFRWFLPQCFYNPDVSGEITDIVQRYKYPATEYNVTTSDGYILVQFRIGDPNGPTILVIHGIYMNPMGWTLVGKDSLAFVLAEAGYDVWLVSLRGTRYTKHESLTQADPKYWEFTPHEMGTIDLPAIIETVSTENGGKPITLLPFSMGSTCSLIYTSTMPDHVAQHNVILQVHIAPIAYMDRVSSIVGLGPYIGWSRISAQLKKSGTYYVLKPSDQSRRTATLAFLPTTANVRGFWLIMGSIFGFSCQLNPATLAATVLNGGDTISVYVMDFYVQIMQTSKFAALDYKDPAMNQEHYGSDTPPEYDLSKIDIPTTLIYALNDAMATKKNVERLHSELTTNTCLKPVPMSGFTHQDFVIAKDGRKLLYQPLADEYLIGRCPDATITNCLTNYFANLRRNENE
ncbi:lipase member K-like [Atheta coriaria]|uniref:lipase member K-like n=1 Tax=Dalotia coriaria TaxID=877792 RepID=UPI0031F46CEC